MNKYVKRYFIIGAAFSGLGPIVLSIVYLILYSNGTISSLNPKEVSIGIITSFVIAFVHAGSSVFPQIEHWSKIKAMLFQGLSIYTVYLVGYLINSWLPLSVYAITLYTVSFLVAFIAIWLIVIITTRKLTNSLNKKLADQNTTK